MGVTARLIREILDRRSLDGSAESANDEIVEGVENAFEFVFEKYLEEFIVNNFDKVLEGRLRLYEDPKEDANGQQYRTAVGRIDILATEPKTKSLVVIELKKGRSSDHVVGQIARYMGWVSENL